MLGNRNKTPVDIIKKISDYLSCRDAHRLFSTSRYLFFSLQPKLQTVYMAPKLTDFIRHAVIGVEKYFSLGAAGNPWWNGNEMCYSIGYQRAACFKDIFLYGSHDLKMRLFGLYTLLREANGSKLKAQVREELAAHFGVDFFKIIEAYVHKHFDVVTRMQLEKQLLCIIHEPGTGKINREMDHGDDFFAGFMEYPVRELLRHKEDKVVNKSCAIS